MLGAEQTDLLAGGDDHLKRRMGNAVFLQQGEQFEDGGNAGFVVAAEDGIARAGENIAGPDHLDPHARFDRVHMAGKKQTFPVRLIAGKADDEIARFRAGPAGGIVFIDGIGAEVGKGLFQMGGNRPFPAGWAADFTEFGKGRGKALAVDVYGHEWSFVLSC